MTESEPQGQVKESSKVSFEVPFGGHEERPGPRLRKHLHRLVVHLRRQSPGEHLGRRPVRRDPPLVQDGDPVRVGGREPRIVQDDHGRVARPGADPWKRTFHGTDSATRSSSPPPGPIRCCTEDGTSPTGIGYAPSAPATGTAGATTGPVVSSRAVPREPRGTVARATDPACLSRAVMRDFR